MAEGCEGEGIHYVHFTDKEARQKLRVKGAFTLDLFPSIEPKLKPQPECQEFREAVVTGQFWRELPRKGEPEGSFVVQVFMPIKPTLIREPSNYVDYPGQDISGNPLPQYYGLNASLQIPWINGEQTQCTNTGGRLQVFGGTYISKYTIDPNTFYPNGIESIPDVYGGITSVRDVNTGEELVEKEVEYCEITVRRKNGDIVLSRKVEGSCGDVQVECEDDCPPGYCKCWISRAAKTFCCAKCGNAEVKETPVVNPGSGNGGNGNGNGGSGD